MIYGIEKKRDLGLLNTSKADVSIAHELIGPCLTSSSMVCKMPALVSAQDAFSWAKLQYDMLLVRFLCHAAPLFMHQTSRSKRSICHPISIEDGCAVELSLQHVEARRLWRSIPHSIKLGIVERFYQDA